jgi:regulator of sigma E protease
MSIIEIILIFSFLILVHELAHFIVAKLSKVDIYEFGIGYPPKIFKLFSWKGTDFTMNAIPFGGFVRLAGELGPEKEDEVVSEEELQEHKIRCKNESLKPFYKIKLWKKISVILAGPLSNFIVGYLSFFALFWYIGVPISLDNQPRIGLVMEDTPASEAGLKSNTNIVGMNIDQKYIEVKKMDQAIELINQNRGKNIILVVTDECDKKVCSDLTKEVEVYVRTDQEIPKGEGAIGIVFDQYYQDNNLPFFRKLVSVGKMAMTESLSAITLIGRELAKFGQQLFSQGKVSENLAGPIGIVHQAHSVKLSDQGFEGLFIVTALISINLAVVNLIPIPALDGGRALFIILSAFIKKSKILDKIEYYINMVGIGILLFLMVVVTFKDVIRLFS